jgi:hypothetical protein
MWHISYLLLGALYFTTSVDTDSITTTENQVNEKSHRKINKRWAQSERDDAHSKGGAPHSIFEPALHPKYLSQQETYHKNL